MSMDMAGHAENSKSSSCEVSISEIISRIEDYIQPRAQVDAAASRIFAQEIDETRKSLGFAFSKDVKSDLCHQWVISLVMIEGHVESHGLDTAAAQVLGDVLRQIQHEAMSVK